MNAVSFHHQRDSPSTAARAAALPMYDLRGVQPANDALWKAIAARLEAEGISGVPETLTRTRPLDEVWTDPRLLLAQTCGYPFASALKDKVQLVATPRYRVSGCDGPFYRSVVVVRAGSAARCLADLRGGRCVVNDRASNSGMNLLRVELAPLARGKAFFDSVSVSGSHEASAERVVCGEADVAAIDCVTWAHLKRWRPELTRRLAVLAWTVRSPGLPFITARDTDAATRAALSRALKDVETDQALREVRGELMLDGFNSLPASHYHAVLYLEQIAVTQGYPRLV
jgi:ABC-type phosphate/phosphonate transport system substrate-binding protein